MITLKTALKYLVLVLVFFVILIFAGSIIFNATYRFPQKIKFGVTFSPKYAGYLKLDWKKTYTRMLDELKVKNLRVTSYWDTLQPAQNKYDFSETDYMLDEGEERGAKIILVLGVRQPRWPECHIPSWAGNLSVPERQQKILEFIQKIVERYKDNSSIWAWQVENEPLLSYFGEGCDAPDKGFLKKEVELVRSLSSKKIIMTDSGELGLWATSMEMSDIFGTTLYRKVNDKIFGYVTYPVPAYLYNIKSSLIRNIFAPKNQKTIIAELQTEPWLTGGDFVSPDNQSKIFTVEDFASYIDFARKTGFDGAYLWGAEWWYFMEEQSHPEYLNYAKSLFK